MNGRKSIHAYLKSKIILLSTITKTSRDHFREACLISLVVALFFFVLRNRRFGS